MGDDEELEDTNESPKPVEQKANFFEQVKTFVGNTRERAAPAAKQFNAGFRYAAKEGYAKAKQYGGQALTEGKRYLDERRAKNAQMRANENKTKTAYNPQREMFMGGLMGSPESKRFASKGGFGNLGSKEMERFSVRGSGGLFEGRTDLARFSGVKRKRRR